MSNKKQTTAKKTPKKVEDEQTTITAYKGFDSDWKCIGFQYEVGKTYEQIAESMYNAYRANHIYKLAEWHQLTSMNRDCWLSAAKAAHKEITEVH